MHVASLERALLAVARDDMLQLRGGGGGVIGSAGVLVVLGLCAGSDVGPPLDVALLKASFLGGTLNAQRPGAIPKFWMHPTPAANQIVLIKTNRRRSNKKPCCQNGDTTKAGSAARTAP